MIQRPIHSVRLWFLAVLLLAGTPFYLKATHIIGGEMSYRCLGNNQYEITLSVYRDCYFGAADAPFDDPASIGIFDYNTNAFLQELRIPFVGDDTLRSFLFDPCFVVPPTVCVHTTTYRDTVTLLQRTGGYYIAYQRCCRNQTINNIINPVRTGATYFIIITEEAQQACNASPVFKEWPPIFICQGTTINYDHSAADPEGDSLAYKLCVPFAGASFGIPKPQPPAPPPYDTVVWVRPTYSLDNVLGAGIPLRIDPRTGLLTGRPDLIGQFVVGICIEEYRDGQLLSMTRRDFQYNVGICGQITSAFLAPDVQCDNRTVVFDNRSQFSRDFKWIFDFPNGTDTSRLFEPTFTYPDTGHYTIALIAEPGSACADTSYHTIFLQDNSIVIDYQAYSFDCVDSTQIVIINNSYDSISPIVSWNWVVNFTGGSVTSNLEDPIFIVPNPDSIEVRLTATSRNGCVKTSVRKLFVESLDPSSTIRDSFAICQGESVELNPLGDPQFVYNWSPATGLSATNIANPVATPNVTTVYSVDVSYNNNFCLRHRDVTVYVQPTPNLDFETKLECDDRTFTFTNTSVTGIADYVWDFGEPTSSNNTSTDVNPVHTYQNPGTYQVTLTLGATSLCQDMLVKAVEVTERVLDANFEVEYLNCEPGEVTIDFKDLSVNSDTLHTITNWSWTINPGGTFTVQNPQITLNQSTDVEVTLTIKTSEGCEASVTRTLDVNLVEQYPPNSQYTCAVTALQLNPNFNPNYRYEWSPSTGLDDPNSPNPTATLNGPQTYMVKISAFGADTCEVIWDVFVDVPPAIDLRTSGDDITCDPITTLRAFTSSPRIDSINWYLNGVLVGMGNTLTVPVSGLQVYTVVAVDSLNCSEFKQIRIGGGPLDVSVSGDQSVCKGDPFAVTITNSDPNDSLVVSWTSIPPDFITSGHNSVTPVLKDTIGVFRLFVEIRNQFGCPHSDSLTLTITDPNAVYDFDYDVLCDGLTVQFTNRSANAFDYVWDFGVQGTNTDVSNDENPVFTYPNIGTYDVTLTSIHNASCADTLVKSVTLGAKVLEAEFDFSYTECSENEVQIQFTNRSTSLQNNITDYRWRFDNVAPFTSNQRDPVVTLNNSATFTATLIIENAVGCIDSVSKTVTVELLDIDLPGAPLVQCAGDITYLNPNFNPNYRYRWSPANQVDDPDAPNPRITVTQPGNYTFTVVVQNFSADTCEVTKTVELIIPQPINLSIAGGNQTCGYPITLSGNGANVANWRWFNINGFPIGNDQNLVVNPVDSATYVLEATDAFGCRERRSIRVDNRQVNIRTSGNVAACENGAMSISVENLDPNDRLTYRWSPANRVNDPTSPNPTVLTDQTGLQIFTVIAENQYGCRDTGNVSLNVLNFDPVYDDEVEICAGVSTQLNPNFSPDQTYEWRPPGGLDDPNIGNPHATLNADRTYTVIIGQRVDTLNCLDTVQVAVDVRDPIRLTVTNDTTLCEQKLLELTVTTVVGGLSFKWSDDPDFDPVLSRDQNIFVNRKGESTFYVMASDDLGCVGMEQVKVNIVPIEVDVDEDLLVCLGESETIEVTNLNPDQRLRFSWEPANFIVRGGNTDSPTVNPTTNTTFTATIENQYGCETTVSVPVEVFDFGVIITATATPDSILPGGTSQLFATLGNTYGYVWSPGGTLSNTTIHNPLASPDFTTTYSVTVTDTRTGCIAVRDVTVVVFDPVCEDPNIFIPNAFSPNDDDNNDVLYVYGQFVEEMHLEIYNRWGQKVFDSDSQTVGWDGTFKGEPLSPDVYGYHLTVKCINGEEYFKKGNVTLMR